MKKLLLFGLFGLFLIGSSSALRAQAIVTVGTGTACTGTHPLNNFWEDNRTGYLFTPAEIFAAGGSPGFINSVALNVCNVQGSFPNFNVKMGTTVAPSLTNFVTAGITNVYSSANQTVTTGWNTFTFTAPYSWNGVDNLYVEICWDNNVWGNASTVQYSTVGANMTYSRYSDGAIGCSMTGGSFYNGNQRANVQFSITPPALTAILPDTVDVLCYGDTSAILAPNVVGGSTPYSFLWSTGSTDSALFNMGAGAYSVTVTDGVGDIDTGYVFVYQPDSVSVTASVLTQLVCDYDLSEAFAVGSGGVPAGSYVWDTNSANYSWDSTGTATPVLLGNNTLSPFFDLGFDFVYFGDTVDEFRIAANGFITFENTNQTGCCDGDPIPNNSIFEPNNAIYAIWEYHTATSSDYSYKVVGTAPFRSLVVSFERLPICCGTFPERGFAQIVLHETSNCIEINTEFYNGNFFGNRTQGIENANGTEAFTYPGRNGTLWNSVSNTHISFCPTDANGLAYNWSTGDVGQAAFGLQPGTHTVTVTDGNGCTNTDDVTISAPISALTTALNASDVSCFGFNDASINPTITGGVNPVMYTWSNGATTSSLSNLAPGTYSVSAEDAVGCTIEVNSITIMEPAILLGSVYEVQNAVCENDENGLASIVVSGGVPPYTPLWSNGEVAYTATQLPAGGNFVQITDANGCQAFLNVNIQFDFNSPTPDIGNNFINQSGAGVTLNTNPSTYSSYLWSNGATSPSILASATGFYWVEVTNAAGCVGSDTAYVEVWPTGVTELSELVGVTMYPNPARDMINFEISTDINALNVSIVDVKGSTVARTTFNNSGVQSLSLDNIAAGVYSVQLSTEEGQVSTQRLIVTK